MHHIKSVFTVGQLACETFESIPPILRGTQFIVRVLCMEEICRGGSAVVLGETRLIVHRKLQKVETKCSHLYSKDAANKTTTRGQSLKTSVNPQVSPRVFDWYIGLAFETVRRRSLHGCCFLRTQSARGKDTIRVRVLCAAGMHRSCDVSPVETQKINSRAFHSRRLQRSSNETLF